MNGLKFDYYYGAESEQFSFYRVPRLLIKDERFKGLSSDAKLLYGLMLDRMSLSIKNQWIDEQNRAYIIYTIDSIQEDLGCGKEKAVKVLAELDSVKGIGLVEKKRRGLGKPDIIYVKNFVVVEEKSMHIYDEKMPAKPVNSTEVGKSDFKSSENQTSRSLEIRLQKVGNSELQKSENRTSRSSEIEPQEVGNSNLQKYEKQTSTSQKNRPAEVRKSDSNYTDMNYIEENQSNLIYPFAQMINGEIDADRTAEHYRAIIRENIDYNAMMAWEDWADRESFNELYEIICDLVCIERQSVKIAGAEYPYEMIRSRFLQLNCAHLQYVISCMKKTTTEIKNIRSYMITALFNASTTMKHYYQQQMQHDMYG